MDFKIKGADEMEFGSNPNKMGGLTRKTADYAEVLENPEKLNRPYIKPTVKKNNRNADKIFEQEIAKANS